MIRLLIISLYASQSVEMAKECQEKFAMIRTTPIILDVRMTVKECYLSLHVLEVTIIQKTPAFRYVEMAKL